MTAKRTPRKNLFGEMSRDKLSTDAAAAAAVVYIEFLMLFMAAWSARYTSWACYGPVPVRPYVGRAGDAIAT